MRSTLLLLPAAALAAASLAAGAGGVRAECIGGTVAALAAKSHGRIRLTDEKAFVFQTSGSEFRLPYANVNTVEYGQRVNRRYVEAVVISPLLLLSKSRKHFVTLGYTDENGRNQALVFQVHKGDVRALLAALEARTGRRVEYQDDEARKSGKG